MYTCFFKKSSLLFIFNRIPLFNLLFDKILEEIFRTNLRFYRQRAKLSQEKLSAKLDKNINYINMIEGKKSIPPPSMIEQIASILEIPSYYLLKSLDEERVLDRNKIIDDASKLIAEQIREILKNLLN